MDKVNSGGVRAHRQAQWRERIARQSGSGLSVEAFCRSEAISVPSFYAWRKRLCAANGVEIAKRNGDVGSFIELGGLRSGCTAPHETAPTEQAKGFEVHLELGDGIVLRLSRA